MTCFYYSYYNAFSIDKRNTCLVSVVAILLNYRSLSRKCWNETLEFYSWPPVPSSYQFRMKAHSHLKKHGATFKLTSTGLINNLISHAWKTYWSMFHSLCRYHHFSSSEVKIADSSTYADLPPPVSVSLILTSGSAFYHSANMITHSCLFISILP